MLIPQNNIQPLLKFLLHRWQILAPLAAIEKVWYASAVYAQANGLPIQPIPIVITNQPNQQIAMIKQQIISMLPKTNFINYNYEAPCPLDPNDFMELYIKEQQQCIEKVQQVVQKLKIQ